MTGCTACRMPSPCWISGCAPDHRVLRAGLVALAGYRSRRKGIITSRQMGSVFTWLRPDDLVFNYWVNNYLMGERPPAFDILAWNADGTNLPGALHGQFLDIFRNNLLIRPGGLSVLGTPLQLRAITMPTFVTGAVTDHLTRGRAATRPRNCSAGRPPSCSVTPGTSPAW